MQYPEEMFSALREVVLEIGTDGKILFASPNCYDQFGVRPSSLRGAIFTVLVGRADEELETVLASNVFFFYNVRVESTVRKLSNSFVVAMLPLKMPKMTSLSIEDEAVLLYSVMVDLNSICLVADMNGDVVFANQATKAMLPLGSQPHLTNAFPELDSPAAIQQHISLLRSQPTQKRCARSVIKTIKHGYVSEQYFTISEFLLNLSSGTYIVITAGQERDDRVETLRSIQLVETLNNCSEGIIWMTEKGLILDLNDVASQVLGPHDQVISSLLMDYLPDQVTGAMRETVIAAAEGVYADPEFRVDLKRYSAGFIPSSFIARHHHLVLGDCTIVTLYIRSAEADLTPPPRSHGFVKTENREPVVVSVPKKVIEAAASMDPALKLTDTDYEDCVIPKAPSSELQLVAPLFFSFEYTQQFPICLMLFNEQGKLLYLLPGAVFSLDKIIFSGRPSGVSLLDIDPTMAIEIPTSEQLFKDHKRDAAHHFETGRMPETQMELRFDAVTREAREKSMLICDGTIATLEVLVPCEVWLRCFKLDGNYVFSATYIDISARHSAEMKNELLQSAFETVPFPIFLFDPQGNILYHNLASDIDSHLSEIFPSLTFPLFFNQLRASPKSRKVLVNWQSEKVQATSHIIHLTLGYAGVLMLTSASSQTPSAELRILQSMYEMSFHPMFTTDEKNLVVDGNIATCVLFGLSLQELQGLSASQMLSIPDDHNIFREGGVVPSRVASKTGHLSSVMVHVNRVFVPSMGRHLNFIQLEQLDAVLQLKYKATLGNTLFEILWTPVLICEEDGTICIGNPAFMAVVGFTLRDFETSIDFNSVFRAPSGDAWTQLLSGTSQQKVSALECEILCDTGPVGVRLHSQPIQLGERFLLLIQVVFTSESGQGRSYSAEAFASKIPALLSPLLSDLAILEDPELSQSVSSLVVRRIFERQEDLEALTGALSSHLSSAGHNAFPTKRISLTEVNNICLSAASKLLHKLQSPIPVSFWIGSDVDPGTDFDVNLPTLKFVVEFFICALRFSSHDAHISIRVKNASRQSSDIARTGLVDFGIAVTSTSNPLDHSASVHVNDAALTALERHVTRVGINTCSWEEKGSRQFSVSISKCPSHGIVVEEPVKSLTDVLFSSATSTKQVVVFIVHSIPDIALNVASVLKYLGYFAATFPNVDSCLTYIHQGFADVGRFAAHSGDCPNPSSPICSVLLHDETIHISNIIANSFNHIAFLKSPVMVPPPVSTHHIHECKYPPTISNLESLMKSLSTP